ncbi:hypothetical protein N7582_000546 [Saccharomyces uvarum]|uniref:Ubiquitin-like domain-containing protein n=1 Tax=Saccharomyces uvarum TaxID=230603 RepID=A0AA35NPZ3_SACUV|nr:hypothetical protein N7582_000546 [Saccharomyces uvarum]CAI4056231.1 hypothetical protein SUVC_02G4770 [Saccharomyces uvarum]
MTGNSKDSGSALGNIDANNTSLSDDDSDDFFMDNSFDEIDNNQSDDSNERNVIVESKITDSQPFHLSLPSSEDEDKNISQRSLSDSESASSANIVKPKSDKPSGRTRGRSVIKESVVEIDSSESKTKKKEYPHRSRSRSKSSVRSISPEQKYKRQKNSLLNTYDENDDFFKELAKEAKKTTSISKESTPDQPKRVYNIKFFSKLEGTINKAVQVKVLGKYEFSRILPAALDGLMKSYKIPKVMKDIYKEENVTLYWNNAKLLKFMTCNSLHIPQDFENEISDIDITIVSKEYEKNFEATLESKLKEEETALFAKERQEMEMKLEKKRNEREESEFREFEFELRNVEETEELKANETFMNEHSLREGNSVKENNGGNEKVMKIALMGQDNKKIYVNVRNSTPFFKVAEYYRIQKQLPQKARIKLLFDHDELNLNECIADQDMEDEDMVDVIVE